MARVRLGNKGVSEVVATVMLVTVTLGMIVGGVFFAQLNLSMQAQATEFENGKASMISLAQMIEGMSLVKGEAGYVRFAVSSGGLSLTPGNERLKITISDEGGASLEVFEDIVNLPKFRGGGGVSSLDYQVLKGVPNALPTDYLIVSPDEPAPLGWVYLKREQGAWVIMDFGRVRVVASGTIRVTKDNGLNWEPVNVVEITYVRIVYGTFSGTNVYNVCARVTNVTTRVIRLPDSTSITVSVERGSYSKDYSVPEQGGNGTIIFLNIVDVELSIGG
ncbi:MAG: hypothetical protein FGF50_08090 [Candidatus Brockarchaeota archaeon]|nr:hypothetical protein [Candidatus Brockarchaeota archaeon]